MAERIRIDHGSFESGKRNIAHWKVPKTVKVELVSFLDDLALGKVNRGKRISPVRQLKYLYALRAPLEFFNKPTSRLVLGDIENLERALASGELANHFTGKPFAYNTQVDMRMLLKVFLRWRLGPAKADLLTGWLDTRQRPKTPDFLTEVEVGQLYRHCRTAGQRFLIAILFDTGVRAEEFHNIRLEDIYLPEGNKILSKIALKQEYSKTLGRTVTLYWKYSLEAVSDYLAERRAEESGLRIPFSPDSTQPPENSSIVWVARSSSARCIIICFAIPRQHTTPRSSIARSFATAMGGNSAATCPMFTFHGRECRPRPWTKSLPKPN